MRLLLVATIALTAVTAGCVPSVSPPSSAHTPGCDDPNVEALIRAKFGEQADHAVHIAIRESHCDPAAYNKSGASGVFQLLGHGDLLAVVCLDADPFWAECNIDAAYLLWQSSGWQPWGG